MSVSACILSVSGPVLLPEERAFLREAQPWGVILMGRSCFSHVQVRALVNDIRDALGRPALIFIDQEGGRVSRLKAPEWPKFPPAAVYGEIYHRDRSLGVEACRIGHQLMALELSNLGITADCAPVGDLRQPTTHDAIGDRAFGYSVETVTTLARTAFEGLCAGGVAGCMKHMPGQGRATVDSHHDLPHIDAPEGLLDLDFSVFADLVDIAPMGMTGHVVLDAYSGSEAATVSETIISEIIRKRIGFDGLLMTDDLGMNALGGTLKDRGQRARAAGCDVLLHCSGFLTDPAIIRGEMEVVASAAGVLSGASKRRAEAAEDSVLPAEDIDVEAAWARFDTIMAQAESGV